MATAQGAIPKNPDLRNPSRGKQVESSPLPPAEQLSVLIETSNDQSTGGVEDEKGILDSVPVMVAAVVVSVVALLILLMVESRRASEQLEFVERSSRLPLLARQVTIDADRARRGLKGACSIHSLSV